MEFILLCQMDLPFLRLQKCYSTETQWIVTHQCVCIKHMSSVFSCSEVKPFFSRCYLKQIYWKISRCYPLLKPCGISWDLQSNNGTEKAKNKDHENFEKTGKIGVKSFSLNGSKTERRDRVLLMVEALLCCTFYPGTGRLAGWSCLMNVLGKEGSFRG